MSVGQESGRSSVGSRCWRDWGLPSLTEAGGYLGCLTHMAGRFMLAVGRTTQFFTARVSPQDCLSVLATWRPAPPIVTDSREKQRKQGGSHNVFFMI